MTTESIRDIKPTLVQYNLSDVFAGVSAELDSVEAEHTQAVSDGIKVEENYAMGMLSHKLDKLKEAKGILEAWQKRGVQTLETDAPFTDGSLTNTDVSAMAAAQITSGRIKPAAPKVFPSVH